jgi:hypothetical protein
MRNVENIEELRNDLLEVYNNLKKGSIGIREAKEQNNTADKIMKSASLQLKYNIHKNSKARILFLEPDGFEDVEEKEEIHN